MTNPSPTPEIYLIGDSIRGSYQSILQALFGRQAVVEGPKDNSFDSANIRRRLDEWLRGRSPVALALNCGLHDVRRSRPDGRLQVPLAEYVANLDAIMARLGGLGNEPPFWLTTTPVEETRHNRDRAFDRYNADIREYNAAALDLASRHGWSVIDLHAVVTRGGPGELLSADGVHCNDRGRLALAEAVIPALRQRVEAFLDLDEQRRSEERVRHSIGYRME